MPVDNFDAELNCKKDPLEFEEINIENNPDYLFIPMKNSYYHISKIKLLDEGSLYYGIEIISQNDYDSMSDSEKEIVTICRKSRVLSLHEVVYNGYMSRFSTQFTESELSDAEEIISTAIDYLNLNSEDDLIWFAELEYITPP
ncbi:MAG: hypothetical protein O0X96_05610 [Methanocorpusculum sp.]|nr:hypothetical protein [Methanocorpusculum sp.]